jgi:hypothetical protein
MITPRTNVSTSGISSHPEHLVNNSKWLINDTHRRIAISSFVPRLHFAHSGTVSSGYLSNHLIEQSDDENSIKFIIESISNALKTKYAILDPKWLQ